MLESVEQVTSIILGLIFFVIILVIAYFAARFMGKHYGTKINGSKNIKIIEKTQLNQDKMLLIVETAGKSMLLGVTGSHIEFISELDNSALIRQKENETQAINFASILKNMINRNNGSVSELKNPGKENNE